MVRTTADRGYIYLGVSATAGSSVTNRKAFFFFFFLFVSSLFLLLLLYQFDSEGEAFLGRRKKIAMSLKVVDASISNFDEVFRKFRSEAPKSKVNLILFLADKNPSTSLSWCPDCVRAEPVIQKKLEASSDDIVLLRAFVGNRPTWRDPAHPWRVDPTFKLKGVPTLIRWENDAISGRLEDHEAHIEAKIDALINK